MLLLAYRNLRTRPARTLFTALAIALGVGMIFAMRIVGVAVEQIADEARSSRLAGADLEVASANNANLDVSLADELAARPEVQTVAPIYRRIEGQLQAGDNPLAPARYVGTGLQLLGVDPARVLTPYELKSGKFFSAPDAPEVLLPASWALQRGLRVGETITLQTGKQTRNYVVVGLLEQTGGFGGPPVAWMPLQTVQAGFETPGAVTAILIRLQPDQPQDIARDQLEADLGTQYTVASASEGGTVRSFSTVLQALQFASFILVLSGAFLVYNAFAITLSERRREIGQLRTLGMTRGQVIQQSLAEALITALLGSGVGLLIGWGLGQGLLATVVATEGISVPAVSPPLDGALMGVGAGVVVTVLVTLRLAWQAGRVSPLAALGKGDAAHRPYNTKWGLIGGVGLLMSYVFVHLWAVEQIRQSASFNDMQAFAAGVSSLLAIATLLLMPAGVGGALWVFERLARRLSLAAQLAAGTLARQRSRAVLTTATLTIGLLVVVVLSGFVLAAGHYGLGGGSLSDFLKHDYLLVRSTAEAVTTSASSSPVPTLPPLAPDLSAALDALSARGLADVYRLGGFDLKGYTQQNWAASADLGLFRHSNSFVPDVGSWEEAEKYFAAGLAITLPESTARQYNLKPGDMVELDTLKGKVPFTVAMVGGFVPLVAPEVGADYFNAHPQYIFFDARPGADREALEDELKQLGREYGLAFTADPHTLVIQGLEDLVNATLVLFAGLTSLSGIVAGLALINTLIASVLERQRELGTLRAIGLSRGQVRALVVIEAGLLGVTGSVIGVLGGLAMSFAFGQLGNVSAGIFFGRELTGVGPLPWPVAGAALVTGPVISMLAALYPADRAANVNPAEAMRAEGATGFLPAAKHLGPTGLRGLVVRMPLAAKLSFTIGLVFVATMALTTVFRVNYERRLLQDNMRSILQRGFDLLGVSTRDAFGAEVTALTPQLLDAIQQQAGVQIETLTAQQASDSPYEFSLRYLFITDPAHKVLLSDQIEYMGRVLTNTVTLPGSSALVRLTDWTGERAFEVDLPIENKAGQRLGIARLGLSTEPVDNVIRDIARSSVWTMLAALAVAVILTMLFTRRALAPVAQVVDASRAVARGDLHQRVPESRWDDVGQLSRAFNEMVNGLNDRERMRDLFGRYLSREVGEAVLAGRVSLKGERKTITVLYCDMRGSTTFAESHAPEDVMAALNQYFEVIILATEAHGGIVNRFVGDEAVCVFGAPTEYRDHAERAVQAALSMREGLAYVNQKRTALGQPVLKFGIGLNTGEVTAGATGSEERQEYTLIGDAMNTGARIQALTKNFEGHDVLLSEFTRAALKGEYALVDLGEVEIRGKSKAVRGYGVERKPASG